MTDDRDIPVEDWLAIRKEEALLIDPETAEVFWNWGQVLDPYGVWANMPDECDCVGRSYFARRPGSEIWVSFDDLPEPVRDALWEKHENTLAFPAGLPAPDKVEEIAAVMTAVLDLLLRDGNASGEQIMRSAEEARSKCRLPTPENQTGR